MLHPIETAKAAVQGAKQVITHPGETLNAIKEGAKEAWGTLKSGDMEKIGHLAGKIIVNLAPGGIAGKIVTKLGTVARVTKYVAKAKTLLKEAATPVIGVVRKTKVLKYIDYNQARNAALEWLEENGFKAEAKNLAKMRLDPNNGKAIGMTDKSGKIGFRVEYGEVDGVYTPHINVFNYNLPKAMQKDLPHFTFPGTQKHVNNIIKRFNK